MKAVVDKDDPPDEWDDEDGDALTRKAAALRTLWIKSVRRHHANNSGQPSNYKSHVRWDGGFDASSRRTYQPVWPKIVQKAEDLGFDATALVETLFAVSHTMTTPNPQEILGAANIVRARRAIPTRDAAVRMAATSELAVFRSALWATKRSIVDPDPRAAMRIVLNDIGRDMSALFRCSMAVNSGNHDIAARWRTAALAQLAQSTRSYLTHWRHILPAEIADSFNTAFSGRSAEGEARHE